MNDRANNCLVNEMRTLKPNLRNQFQSAYRRGHSTETAPLKIVNDLLLSLDDDTFSLLSYVRGIRRYRAQHFPSSSSSSSSIGFHHNISGRIQSVSVHSHTSVPGSVSCGVPQGLVLGPIRFVLFTTPLSLLSLNAFRSSIIHTQTIPNSRTLLPRIVFLTSLTLIC